jgi:putative PEP-CTERM system TPR-repeat lipoprotein
VLAQDAGNEKALVALSKIAVGEGRQAEAMELLNRAVEHNPGSIKPALLLSELGRQQGETARALELARNASKDHPRNPGVLKVLLRAQAAAGDLDGAIATLQTLIGISPPSAQLHYQLAQLHLKRKDAKAAREHLEQAIRLQPDNPSAQMMLGRLEILEKNYAAAGTVASELQQAHPKAAGGYQLEGDVLVARGQIKEALPAYEKAYGLKPNSRLVVALFNARRLTGDTDGAVALAREWLEDHPRDVGMRLSLASQLQQQGHDPDALEEYLAVLEHYPGHIGALKNVALLYHAEGSDEGIRYAKKAYELAPGRPDILDTYGWLLVKGGDSRRGLVLLQEAVVKAPHLPEVRYHMAVALAEAGRNDEARGELERLLDKQADFPGAGEARELLDQLDRER